MKRIPERDPSEEYSLEGLREVGNWKIVLDNGTECLRVAGFPGCEGPLWVLIVEGNDSEGVGRVASLVPSSAPFRAWALLEYAGGSGSDIPYLVRFKDNYP